jgi:predicted transcriptional regulator
MLKKTVAIILMAIFIAEFVGAGSVHNQYMQNEFDINHSNSLSIKNQKPMDILAMNDHYFIENNGQITNPNVKYYSPNGKVWFTDDGVWFETNSLVNYDRVILKQEFIDANTVQPVGRERLSWNNNFFYGNDSSEWSANVPNFQEIYYEDLYDGIDLRYYSNENGLKYDFIVHPGADPNQIKIHYAGASGLDLDDMGNLIIQTPINTLVDGDLFIYQEDESQRREVNGMFSINEQLEYGFEISDGYNKLATLIIDPLLQFSTLIGGVDNESSISIAVDSLGNSYVLGVTYYNFFPTTPGVVSDSNSGRYDCVIFKLNPAGSKLIYSTYIGGKVDDIGSSIAVDTSGNAYITGETTSDDFPTSADAYDRIYNSNQDIFVLKLNFNGSKIMYSTFVGTKGYEHGNGIDVDSSGYAYVTGETGSPDFPTTPGAYNESVRGFSDILVFKLNQTGTGLVFSTVLGGKYYDYGQDIEVDSTGNVYVTGSTPSPDFPVTNNAFDSSLNDQNDIVAFKLNHNASELEYSTYIGGSQQDAGTAIALDSNNNAYITGWTSSTDFPTTSDSYVSPSRGFYDVFVIKLNQSGSKLSYSSVVGDIDIEYGYGIVVDSRGNSYVVGYTISKNFPTTVDAESTSIGGVYDAYFFKLNNTGSLLSYSTLVGGKMKEYSYGIAIDPADNIYTCGFTNSTDFPTTSNSYGVNSSGGYDIFVQKYLARPYINIESISTPGNQKPTMVYPKYQEYTFRVNLIDSDQGKNIEGIILKLAPEYSNIQLAWDYATETFTELSDPDDLVYINPSSSAHKYFHNGLIIDFNVTFNWTYLDETPQDVQIYATSKTASLAWLNASNLYRVENDLVFRGELIVKGEDNRVIHSSLGRDSLVRGGETLYWSGLGPVYEGTTFVYPPQNELDIVIIDEDGNFWLDSPPSGTPFQLETISPEDSKSSFNYTIKLTGIPEESDKTNVTFQIKVDGDNVIFSNFTPSESIYQLEYELPVGITITDIGGAEVNASSVQYSFSTDGGSSWSYWTQVSNLKSAKVVEPKVPITFVEGDNNLVRWKAQDSIGNGPWVSLEYRVIVDTQPVRFSNPVPAEDETLLEDTVEVGILVTDTTSGVNASSIEYALSYDEGINWLPWKSVNGLINGLNVNPRLFLNLPNGTGNRIKWRAIDLAGNGPVESDAYSITINTWKPLPIPEVTLKFPQNGSIVNTQKPKLGWLVDYNGSHSISYDIYFGTSSDPELIVKKFSEAEYIPEEELVDGQIYYWKIVPRANGIKGPASPIWSFSIDTGYKPVFDFDFSIPSVQIDIKQGDNATVNISIRNLGDLADIILIDLENTNKANGVNIRFAHTVLSTIELELSSMDVAVLKLIIQIDSETPLEQYTITIKGISQRAKEYGLDLEKEGYLTVNVLEKPSDIVIKTPDDDFQTYIYLFIVVLIILVLLVVNKIERNKVLANFQRNAIFELIKDKPGIHFRKVMRTLNLKPGTLSYHLNVLEKESFIKSIQKGEYRCFYAEGVKSDLKIKLSNIQQNIIFIISENPGISLTQLAETAERNKMVLFYNTSVLEDIGIIKKEKRGRVATFYLTALASPYLKSENI